MTNSTKRKKKKQTAPQGTKKESTKNEKKTAQSQEDVSERKTEVAKGVFEKIKEGMTGVFTAGAKVVDEITQTTHEYAERYKHNVEMKKLGEQRDGLTAKLGMITFDEFKSSDKLPAKFLDRKDVAEHLREIEKLERQIVKVGKRLEKSKE